MADVRDFVGTWRAEPGAPLSAHVFTWVLSDDGLRGEWTIEAPARVSGQPPGQSDADPRGIRMQVGEPSLDEGRVLFNVNGGPVVTEFRLVGTGDAVLGAAIDRLPTEFTGPEFTRSIEGHRIRLRKLPETAA